MVPEAGHGVGPKLIPEFLSEYLPRPEAKPGQQVCQKLSQYPHVS